MNPGHGNGALLFLRRAGLVLTAGVGAGFACLGAVLDAGTPAEQHRLHRHALRAAGATGGVIALAVLALTGMATALDSATAPVLLLCAIALTPWAWARYSSRAAPDPVAGGPDRAPPAEPGLVVPHGAVPVPESLSTPGLCGQWQRSDFALRAATDPVEREQLAELRRRYLGELERRDPEAVARWLAGDARPAGTSPARHLTPSVALAPTDRPGPSAGTDPLPGATS